jgi:hypothetical protein
MIPSITLRLAAALIPAILITVTACSDDPTGPPPLKLVIGDFEGPQSPSCPAPGSQTLPTANSLNAGAGVSASGTLTFANLLDVTSAATGIAFVFDSGGQGFSIVFCGRGGDAQEDDGITANGPNLIKPWHLEGLRPGASYTMTFTGGGRGTVRRSMRAFVDADGDGVIESNEVRDLIGLDGVAETRTFGPIIAGSTGRILGQYWGGSTNEVGENGAWEGWTIVSTP